MLILCNWPRAAVYYVTWSLLASNNLNRDVEKKRGTLNEIPRALDGTLKENPISSHDES